MKAITYIWPTMVYSSGTPKSHGTAIAIISDSVEETEQLIYAVCSALSIPDGTRNKAIDSIHGVGINRGALCFEKSIKGTWMYSYNGGRGFTAIGNEAEINETLEILKAHKKKEESE
jgi:hypothetical protein